MAIVDTTTPITYAKSQTYLQQLAALCDTCRLQTLTTTAFGREVTALEIGTGQRRVLYTAAHHANEWITALILLKFAEELLTAAQNATQLGGVDAAALGQDVTICLVPMVDPDGVDLVVGAATPAETDIARRLAENYPSIPFPDGWKANLLGVDLNLNYPARWLQAREIKFSQGFTRPGPRDYVARFPLDQRESRALAAYTEQVDPALVLAYHSQGREIYWQFLDYDVPGAEALGQEFARSSGYTLAQAPFNSSFAGYKDWFIQQYRRPGYTIEVGQGENPLPLSQFDTIYAENLGILLTAAAYPGKSTTALQ